MKGLNESMHILILTPHKNREKIERYEAGESMLLALEEKNITWDYHAPWEKFEDDFNKYDAVLVWAYNGKKHNMIFWATKFEAECEKLGIPVINSIKGCFYSHSYCYKKWNEANIPCPKYQNFQNPEEINLKYPIILRVDDQHEAKNVFLAHNYEEAVSICEEQLEKYINLEKNDKITRPLDLAIEYQEVRAEDGYYHKRRTIVIGDKLIRREHTISDNWIVNISNRVANEHSRLLNQDFYENGDVDAELVFRAAKALNSDVVALDYTIKSDGEYIFWEGNKNFKMYGNKIFGKDDINPATGRNYEQMRSLDLAVGRAIVDLIYQRVENRAGAS